MIIYFLYCLSLSLSVTHTPTNSGFGSDKASKTRCCLISRCCQSEANQPIPPDSNQEFMPVGKRCFRPGPLGIQHGEPSGTLTTDAVWRFTVCCGSLIALMRTPVSLIAAVGWIGSTCWPRGLHLQLFPLFHGSTIRLCLAVFNAGVSKDPWSEFWWSQTRFRFIHDSRTQDTERLILCMLIHAT